MAIDVNPTLLEPQAAQDRSDWTTVHFGDVVRNCKVTVDAETSGLERYVAGEHMDTDDLRIRRWGTVGDGYLGPAFHRKFMAGQVLYGSRRTYLRKVAVADFDGICANTTFVLQPASDDLVPALLPFIMQTERFTDHSVKNSKGSVNPYINWKDIASYEFALPPLDEQRRIARILQAVDECIQALERAIDELGAFHEAFRDSVFDADRTANDWPVRKLGELFSVQLGKMASPKARRGISPTPYLANYNVQWDRLGLEDVQTMDFSEREKAKLELKPGDLLVCEGGEIGRTAIWSGEIPGCCYQKALHRLRSLAGELEPEVMLEFMRFAAHRGLLDRLTGHSTIAHLTAERLRTVQVPVPPRDAQLEIIRVIGLVKLRAQESNMHLEATRCLKRHVLSTTLSTE